MAQLNDILIKRMAVQHGMIDPFVDHQVREENGKDVISYGLSSFGYDFRLGNNLIVPDPNFNGVRDVKNDNDDGRIKIFVEEYYDIPPHGFILAETLERWKIPAHILVVVYGKSTWAREALIVNVTPMEPEWEGILTLEISNTTNNSVRIYVGEGIGQAVFFAGDRPKVTYADRKGKYQNQSGVTLSKL